MRLHAAAHPCSFGADALQLQQLIAGADAEAAIAHAAHRAGQRHRHLIVVAPLLLQVPDLPGVQQWRCKRHIGAEM